MTDPAFASWERLSAVIAVRIGNGLMSEDEAEMTLEDAAYLTPGERVTLANDLEEEP